MGQYKNRIILGVIILITLTVAFLWGGDMPEEKFPENEEIQVLPTPTEVQEELVISQTPIPSQEPQEYKAEEPQVEQPQKTQEPVQEIKETEKPAEAVEPQRKVCTISISCSTILNNMDLLDSDKIDIVPEDGIILGSTEVEINDGDSVFSALQRVTREKRIHMEFTNTPIYNSAYIEGIANFYEFDCGELSGWVYKVNGEAPRSGCSNYILSGGENIEWVYTCDLGKDVGGYNF